MNKLFKNCPNCYTKIKYKTKSQLNDSIKKNRVCKSCVNRLRKYNGSLDRTCIKCNNTHTFSSYTKYKKSTDTIQQYKCKSCILSIIHTGKSISDKQKEHLRKLRTGAKVSDETKYKLSEQRKGKNNPCYGRLGKLHPMFGKFGMLSPTFGKSSWIKGKKHSEKSLEKMRISALNRVKLFGVISYNPKACKYFDQLNKETGWNLQHALNGGEIDCVGYSIDAYDKDKNIIVEYDEHQHYDKFGNLKERDIKRMNRLKDCLKCSFYRYNEQKQKFKKYE